MVPTPTRPLDAPDRLDRRELLKLGATAGLGVALSQLAGLGCASHRPSLVTTPTPPFRTDPIDEVRIGFVGVGGMGTNHVRNLVRIEGARICAVCDIREAHAQRAQTIIEEAGQPQPRLYTRSETDFLRLCETEDLDLVYTATPWRWHVPVCVAAMRNGKHAATEVPAAYTIEGCWQLVETAERHRKHCVMMENCCYDRPELMCLNLARKGLLGELLHAECGYLHDLRAIKFATTGEGLWRRAHSQVRNGNLYPTHGLGPVAQCMNINRGDQLDYLVSMSSPSRGLQLYQEAHLDTDDPRRLERFTLGDVNLTLIKTVQGRTIYVVHDTNLPRPYSRKILVQGTTGLFQRWPDRLHIEGHSPAHQWDTLDKWSEYEHPLWQNANDRAAGVGHGGMDYLENHRLIHCLRKGIPTDMDVYDAATWSAVGPLSEQSVTNRSRPIDIPDFTQGHWPTRPPLAIVRA